MKNEKLIITGELENNQNPIKNNLNGLNLINIHDPDHVFHQAPSPGAPVSRVIRPGVLSPVGARDEEFGKGMPEWEEGRRGDFDERGLQSPIKQNFKT